jgi:hypothetical protein
VTLRRKAFWKNRFAAAESRLADSRKSIVIIASTHVEAEVVEICVQDSAMARLLRLPGSPTIRSTVRVVGIARIGLN